MGEATHPGPDESPHSESSDVAVSNPAPSLPATQVDCDDELQLAHDLANVPGPEVHVLSQGSSGSDTESLGPIQRVQRRRLRLSGVHSQANMFHCTGKFASQRRFFAIWPGAQGWSHEKVKCRGSSANSVGLR